MLFVVLAQLAFFYSCAYAFFPYKPKWLEEREEDGSGAATRNRDQRTAGGLTLGILQRTSQVVDSPAERAARDAVRLSDKYSRRHTTQVVTGSLFVKRDNQYQIMQAAGSSEANTAGISQDGTDYSYFVRVELGSSGKEVWMLVDTGAGSSWVMGSTCNSKPCSMHDTFGPDDSKTLETNDDPFSVSYGSGKVQGTLATDTISLAGLSFKYQFGLATEVSDDFSSYAFDGILGLSVSKGANANFLETLAEAGGLDKNMFAIALNRASDGKNNGEIKFGSTNKDKYTGDITYTSLSKDGDWAVQVDDMAFDGKKANVGGKVTYIDTGTSYMFGPKDLVKSLHNVIPDAESADGVTYSVPCNTNKPLTVTFSGTDFDISPKDWIAPKNNAGKCTSNVYGYEVVAGAWLFGDTFLKNVYAVFDRDEKRIGFAKLSGETTTESVEATSTGGSGSTQASGSSTDESTKTSSGDSNSETGSTTVDSKTTVTSVPESDASSTIPPMGLSGHETHATTGAAATQTSGKSNNDHDSAAAPKESPLQNAKLALVLGLVAVVLMSSY